jgi:hypothetical protein
MTTALQCVNSLKPYTLAGFKPGIFCSVGGRDDHYATPPVYVSLYEIKSVAFYSCKCTSNRPRQSIYIE